MTDFAPTLMLVLSANILEEAVFRQLDKSLIYIKNKRGPKLLPGGTPHVILTVSEISPLTQHLWLWLLKYD